MNPFLQDVCIAAFTRDKSAKVKNAAISALIKVWVSTFSLELFLIHCLRCKTTCVLILFFPELFLQFSFLGAVFRFMLIMGD